MKTALALAVLVAQALAVGADQMCYTSSVTATTALASPASPTIACCTSRLTTQLPPPQGDSSPLQTTAPTRT